MLDSKSRSLLTDDATHMRNIPTYRVGDLTIGLTRYEVFRFFYALRR